MKTQHAPGGNLSGHILVVDDSLTNQILIQRMLEREGLTVSVADDGEAALEMIREGSFDLVLMDILMPKRNGYQTTRAIREMGLRTPVIAVTACANAGTREQCLAAGCDDYTTKPVDRKVLLEMISGVLDKLHSEAGEDGLYSSESGGSVEKACEGDAEAASVEAVVIDWGQLISRMVDEDIVREVVPVYLVDNRERMEMLAEAVGCGQAEEIKRYAHSIKGAAASLGAKCLAELAYRLECMGQQGDLSGASDVFEQLRQEYLKVESFLSDAHWIEKAKRQAGAICG